MRIVAALLACASVGAAALPAAADTFIATRSALLVERTHTIEVRIGRGSARMVVRRAVRNGGERFDQATFHIDLPSGAVATRLRTSALVDGELRWFEGELLEAELAARRYQELTGIGGYYPKDPALLSWRAQQRLTLQVFPCPPGEDKTVEYTLTLPTTYSGGRERLLLPSMGTPEVTARATIFAEHPEDPLFVDGSAVAHGKSLLLDGPHEIAIRPQVEGDLTATLAMVPFAERRALMHYRVATPPALSVVPRGASVVVLLDASRSMSEQQLLATRHAARAYLHHFAGTGAQVAVVPFARFPRPRSSGFVGVHEAMRDLATAPLARANGSAIDAALGHARSLLETTAATAPRRVLLVSDLEVRSALSVAEMRRSLPPGTVLHVSTIHHGSAFLNRDDSGDDGWGGIARATGGLLWSARARPADDEPARDVFEEWARPVRIHNVKLELPGLPDEANEGFSLDEGEEVDKLGLVPRGSPFLRVSGEVWSRKVTELVPASMDEGRRWSALAFGSPVLHELNEREMMPLAFFGRAVSPVTSYLAIEPGVRPSTEGLESSGFGEGFGRGSGSHRTRSPFLRMGAVHTFDGQAFLTARVRDAWRSCGGSDGAGAVVSIQTTRDEIVDVAFPTPAPSFAAAHGCFREAIWSIELPADFKQAMQDFVVTV
jgi:hypothetical protein